MKLFRFIILLLIIGFGSIYWINVKSDANSEKLSVPEKVIVSNDLEFYSNEILIKFKNNANTQSVLTKDSIDENDQASIISLSKLKDDNKIKKVEKIIQGNHESSDYSIFRWYKITLTAQPTLLKGKFDKDNQQIEALSNNNSSDFKNALSAFKKDPDIEDAQPNYIIKADTVTPNDPYYLDTVANPVQRDAAWNPSFDYMWGLKKINAVGGWNISTGSGSLTIADIDSGIDTTHPDLTANIWTNTGETASNGIDDDGNGKIDDVNGWNFYANTNNIQDDYGHGTHTAGIMGGVGNNGVGVVGVPWNVKIMPLKVFDSNGIGTADMAAQAFKYASDMGAKVSSNSWHIGSSALLDDTIDYAYKRGMVIVASAGNDNTDLLDQSLGTTSGQIIFVGSTGHTDSRSTFSNYGSRIDVYAPGEDILSTRPHSDTGACNSANVVNTLYCVQSGTSASTPYVAGLAALIRMADSALSKEQVRQVIRMGSDDIGVTGWDSIYGFGRINVGTSLSDINPRPPAPFISSPYTKGTINGSSVQITGGITGVNAHGYKLEYGLGRDPQSWTLIAQSTSVPSNGIFGTMNTYLLDDGLYQFRLSSTDAASMSFENRVFDVKVQNFTLGISSPQTIVNSGTISLIGDADVIYAGQTLANYTIEWADTATQPLTYSTSGITLQSGGTQAVYHNTLGTWDTTGLTHGHSYSLRLTAQSGTGAHGVFTTQVALDKNLVSGWPIFVDREASCSTCHGSPELADLLGDGKNELIYEGPSNKIYAFKRDGTNLSGFPASVDSNYLFAWPPTISDLDQDDKKEIVSYGISSDYSQAKIYVTKYDGSAYSGWTNPTFTITHPASESATIQGYNGSPAIADINSDGVKEIIFLDVSQKKVHAYKLNGTELSGFPKTITAMDATASMTGIAIADMDNNGGKEIAFGNGNKLFLLDNSGNVITGFPVTDSTHPSSIIKTTPSFGDIDNDGKLEVVVGAVDTNTAVQITAYKKTGALLSGFPQSGGTASSAYWPLSNLSITDLDGDGKDDIISGVEHLSIHKTTGATQLSSSFTNSSPAISDIAGDSVLRFIAPQSQTLKIFNQDGSTWWTSANFTDDKYFTNPATISDMDSNGNMEMAAVKTSSTSPYTALYLWEIPAGGFAKKDWPLYGHDSLHSNVIEKILPATAITQPVSYAGASGIYQITSTATDNIETGKVEFYVDGQLLATSRIYPYTASWDTTGYIHNSTHTLYTKAYDLSGNVKQSTSVVGVKAIDITPPTVSITFPTNNAYVTKNAVTTIAATASDISGISKVEFRVNGVLKCTDSSTPYTCAWTVPNTTGTTYTLQAKAYDTATTANTATHSIQVTSQ